MNKKKTTKKVHLLHCFFWIYVAVLIYLLLLSEREEYTYYRYNLVMFQEIKRFLNGSRYFSNMDILLNLLGNVVGFVPLGFMLPMIHKRKIYSLVSVFFVFMFSFMMEVIQLTFRIGVFDVDDLFLNTLGGFIGFLCYFLGQRILNLRRRKKSHEK